MAGEEPAREVALRKSRALVTAASAALTDVAAARDTAGVLSTIYLSRMMG